MPVVRLRLKQLISRYGLTPKQVVEVAAPYISHNTVYRLLRQEERLARIDFPTLAALLVALRKLTGEDVLFNDLFEFDPDDTSPR